MQQHRHYNIRSVTEADTLFLREMLYYAVYIPAGTPSVDRAILDSPAFINYFRNWGKEADTGLIADTLPHYHPIGAAWLRLFSQQSPGFGYINDNTPELTIAVLPEQRGHGVGTKLLTHLLECACQNHATISLSVDPNNPAVRLYQRFGFQTIGVNGTSLTMKRDCCNQL